MLDMQKEKSMSKEYSLGVHCAFRVYYSPCSSVFSVFDLPKMQIPSSFHV